MDKLSEIMNAARQLTADERRRLMSDLLALDAAADSVGAQPPGRFSALRALSGAFHSDYSDLSTDKYAHVGVATDGEE